jgi:hypothetical protein
MCESVEKIGGGKQELDFAGRFDADFEHGATAWNVGVCRIT